MSLELLVPWPPILPVIRSLGGGLYRIQVKRVRSAYLGPRSGRRSSARWSPRLVIDVLAALDAGPDGIGQHPRGALQLGRGVRGMVILPLRQLLPEKRRG